MKVNIRHCYTLQNGVEKKIRIAKGKKKRDIKVNKIKNKDIIPRVQASYTPQFSFHALQRISERMCEPVKQRKYVDLHWVKLWMTIYVRWIRPKFLKQIISDVRYSFVSYIYSTSSDTIMSKWKLARYIIAKWGEVITVLTDEKMEKKYMKKHKFITMKWHSLKLFLNTDDKGITHHTE